MRILGIDEVGRGPWAGPLVVGACVLREPIEGLTDSKKLSKKRREELSEEIWRSAEVGLGWVSAGELDEMGLAEALRRAARLAAAEVKGDYDEIVIDGTVNLLAETKVGQRVTTLKKADALVPAVSAASIVAKVARDNYMVRAAQEYSGYGFERHVGYGTAAHRKALSKLGVCPEHRRSVKPVARICGGESTVGTSGVEQVDVITSCSTLAGVKAEEKVAEYLGANGHQIVARNWKTPICEVDIVSVLNDGIYFTEVKYRKNDRHGNGLEAVTAEKLRKMTFAAECFLKCYNILDKSPLLMTASVGGEEFSVRDLVVLG